MIVTYLMVFTIPIISAALPIMSIVAAELPVATPMEKDVARPALRGNISWASLLHKGSVDMESSP